MVNPMPRAIALPPIPRRAAQAFTLIEMLVVITVVMVLMGLLLKGAQVAREGARRTRSQTIVGAIANGLAAAQGENLALPLTPHPLANTATGGTPAATLVFRRGAIDPIRLDPVRLSMRQQPLVSPSPYGGASGTAALWSSDAFASFDGVTAVPTNPGGGIYVMGSERFQFPATGAAHGQLGLRLLANDVFADTAAPMFYGCKRELMWVLGTHHPELVRYLACPAVDKAGAFHERQTQAVQLVSGLTAANYPDLVVAPSVIPAQSALDTEIAIHRVLGSTWDQLRGLNALREPIDDTSLIWSNRLWSNVAGGGSWQPGMVNAGGWRSYQLRGLALYDGWDREIVVSQGADGRVRVISAGKDGCMRIAPGPNKTYQSTTFTRRMLCWCTDWAAGSRGKGLSGDDQDASIDNIAIGVEPGDYYDVITTPEAAYFGVTE
jgi:type II secretory pathway pseudopilin PulG